MGRRVLILVLVLVVALFAYLGYNSYDARRAGANGDVFSIDSPAPKGQTVVYPPQNAETGPVSQDTPRTAPQMPETQGHQVQAERPSREQMPDEAAQQNSPRTHDTISPNPPNGMVFSGRGKYQLYRQGDLTWRLNTDTGQSCILFATDEQWKKPRVYRAGCGSH